jgi:hypothetical protein
MDDETPQPLAIRDEKGRLLPGSKLAVGARNPHASRISELKTAMLAAVTPQDMVDVMLRLLDLTKNPDGKIALAAIELFQNRTVGKPKESIELDVTTDGPATPSRLDAEDVAALERMRAKLGHVVDAEVIVRPNE